MLSALRSKRRLVDGVNAAILPRLLTIYAGRGPFVRLGLPALGKARFLLYMVLRRTARQIQIVDIACPNPLSGSKPARELDLQLWMATSG